MLVPEPSTGKIHAVGHHFYVKPKYRRTKLAWELYNTVLELVKDKAQIHELFCFNNSINFWEKRGYTVARNLIRLEGDHV